VDPLRGAGRCGGAACGRGFQCSVLAKARLPLGHLRLRLRFADLAQCSAGGKRDHRFTRMGGMKNDEFRMQNGERKVAMSGARIDAHGCGLSPAESGSEHAIVSRGGHTGVTIF